MNSPLSIEQLKRIKGIMLSMLAEASIANWQELSRLDSERRVMLNYQGRVSDSSDGCQEISLGGQPVPVPRAESTRTAPEVLRTALLSHSTKTPDNSSAVTVKSSEYHVLSAELAALDQEIITTVLKARQSVLEQTRGLQAQVSAKKCYEQANVMKVSSYS